MCQLVCHSNYLAKIAAEKKSVVCPIEACNIFFRLQLSTSCEKKGRKKLLHCSFYVCVVYYRDQKRHLSCRRARSLLQRQYFQDFRVNSYAYWQIQAMNRPVLANITQQEPVWPVFTSLAIIGNIQQSENQVSLVNDFFTKRPLELIT